MEDIISIRFTHGKEHRNKLDYTHLPTDSKSKFHHLWENVKDARQKLLQHGNDEISATYQKWTMMKKVPHIKKMVFINLPMNY